MKTLLGVVAVAVLTSGALAAPIATVSVDSYSGRLGSTWDAPMSLDGDPATLWYSQLGNDTPKWIVYAFDQAYEVGDVAITMSNGNYRKLATAAVSISTDNVTFTPVGEFPIDVANGAVTTFSLGGAMAQYVRIDGVRAFFSNWDPDYADYPPDPELDRYAISYADITFDAIPEPATASLLALGAAAGIRRRR